MTSQGSAQAWFQRAVKAGRVLNAGIAARELGAISLSDALALVLLYTRAGNDKFERAARRWVRRAQVHHSLRHREVELLRASMGALRTRFDPIALTVLMEACQETATTSADAAALASR
jgi:sugar/nucleoside kinase (ribokinase family)